MRARVFSGLLAAGLLSGHAHAALTPTLDFEEGPLASVPVTGGSLSGAGVTLTGAPLVGGPSQSILQVSDNVTLGGLFNPLQISVTEYNLTNLGALNSFVAAINGTLPTQSSLTWAAYVDPTNAPFGTAQLIASDTFSDPSSLLDVGFTDSVPGEGTLSGPFALTELITLSGPAGDTFAFNSSVSATSNAVPEPMPLAVLGVGLLGLGCVVPWRRGGKLAALGPVEHY